MDRFSGNAKQRLSQLSNKLRQKGQERGSQGRWCATRFRVTQPSLSCLTAVKAARPTPKNSTDLAECKKLCHAWSLTVLPPSL